MSIWDAAVEATQETTTVEEFEALAYRLVAEQVLYENDRNGRIAYGLVREFEKTFQRALEPLGIRLQVNATLRYACAIPRHPKAATASVAATLLALVLRRIYDQEARAGRQDENGDISVDLDYLSNHYKQATGGREIPGVGALRDLLRTMQRWGIARAVGDPEDAFGQGIAQPFIVVIRPGIVDVLGEAALQRLALFEAPGAEVADSPQDEETGEEEVGEEGPDPAPEHPMSTSEDRPAQPSAPGEGVPA